jgi:hypothetical protein
VFVNSLNLDAGRSARTTIIRANLANLPKESRGDENCAGAKCITGEQLLLKLVNASNIDFIKRGEFGLLARISNLPGVARPRKEGVEYLSPGEVVFAVVAENSTREPALACDVHCGGW